MPVVNQFIHTKFHDIQTAFSDLSNRLPAKSAVNEKLSSVKDVIAQTWHKGMNAAKHLGTASNQLSQTSKEAANKTLLFTQNKWAQAKSEMQKFAEFAKKEPMVIVAAAASTTVTGMGIAYLSGAFGNIPKNYTQPVRQFSNAFVSNAHQSLIQTQITFNETTNFNQTVPYQIPDDKQVCYPYEAPEIPCFQDVPCFPGVPCFEGVPCMPEKAQDLENPVSTVNQTDLNPGGVNLSGSWFGNVNNLLSSSLNLTVVSSNNSTTFFASNTNASTSANPGLFTGFIQGNSTSVNLNATEVGALSVNTPKSQRSSPTYFPILETPGSKLFTSALLLAISVLYIIRNR